MVTVAPDPRSLPRVACNLRPFDWFLRFHSFSKFCTYKIKCSHEIYASYTFQPSYEFLIEPVLVMTTKVQFSLRLVLINVDKLQTSVFHPGHVRHLKKKET